MAHRLDPHRSLAGLAAAAVALGVAALLAIPLGPHADSRTAVGSVVIDLTPGPVKEWAIQTFGTADKLFLSVAVRRELGVRETSFSDEQIRDLLRDVGISVVVAQRDFWTDLGQMAALQRVLDGPDFEEIDRIPVVANVPVEDHELRVYRARWDPRPARRDLVIDLPIVGRSVQGRGAAP